MGGPGGAWDLIAWHVFIGTCAVVAPVAVTIGMHLIEVGGGWGLLVIVALAGLEFLAGWIFGPLLEGR